MIATKGLHYTIHIGRGGYRSMDFTLRGLEELSLFQRRMIEVAFHNRYLGDTYDLDEYTEVYEYEPLQLAQDWEEGSEECVTVDAEEEHGREACRADEVYNQGRDDAAFGVDSIYARMFKRARGR